MVTLSRNPTPSTPLGFARVRDPERGQGGTAYGERDAHLERCGSRQSSSSAPVAGLPAADRRFVCELAVFDWIDADLVDEVLDSTDTGARIAGLSPLDGLLASKDEAGGACGACTRSSGRAEWSCRRARTGLEHIAETVEAANMPAYALRNWRAAGKWEQVVLLAEGRVRTDLEWLAELYALVRRCPPTSASG